MFLGDPEGDQVAAHGGKKVLRLLRQTRRRGVLKLANAEGLRQSDCQIRPQFRLQVLADRVARELCEKLEALLKVALQGVRVQLCQKHAH